MNPFLLRIEEAFSGSANMERRFVRLDWKFLSINLFGCQITNASMLGSEFFVKLPSKKYFAPHYMGKHLKQKKDKQKN